MMEDRSGLFGEINGFSQRKLKKVETKVVTGTGETLTEKRNAKGVASANANQQKSNGNQPARKLDLQVGLIVPGLLIGK